jgi:hypothetical protein
MGVRLVCQYCGHVHDAKKNKKYSSNQQMSEVRQKLIVGIFSSVFIDKSKYCKNKSFQPFFCLIEGSPHPPPQARSKNDGHLKALYPDPRTSSKESIPPAYVAYSVGS